MMRRPFKRTSILAIIVLTIVVFFATGCGSETPAPEVDSPAAAPGDAPVPPPAPASTKPEDDELTTEQKQALKQQLSDRAVKEITAKNAETMATQLEKEIQADLADM